MKKITKITKFWMRKINTIVWIAIYALISTEVIDSWFGLYQLHGSLLSLLVQLLMYGIFILVISISIDDFIKRTKTK